MILNFALPMLAYLLGSISSAILISKFIGISDPREVGSGNPGATNVLRYGGGKAAFFTLLGDASKAVVTVIFAQALGLSPTIATLVGVCALIGHMYPVFYKFKGGKGIATMIGMTIAIDPLLGTSFIACWGCIAAISRYSSLAALGAVVLTPFFAWKLDLNLASIALLVLAGILIFFRHKANIKNLITGTEKKIGDRY
jgi:acyl phosphate:glycerol-3-phosphate acyltransferase